MRYSDMETKLGEIDRARGIYSYSSQMCDPRVWFLKYFKFCDFLMK